jgi:dTDP-4-dehydrorhamnose reductase
MYGVSDSTEELDEDNSKKNPVTVYAKTKWEAEKNIKDKMIITLNTNFFMIILPLRVIE